MSFLLFLPFLLFLSFLGISRILHRPVINISLHTYLMTTFREPQISDIRMMMSLMSAIRFHAAGITSSHVLFSLQYSTWQSKLK
jgi:hypothetical protein